MPEAIAILEQHLASARAQREWHLSRRRRDNVDAAVAGLKVAWLKAILLEMHASPAGRAALHQAEGGE